MIKFIKNLFKDRKKEERLKIYKAMRDRIYEMKYHSYRSMQGVGFCNVFVYVSRDPLHCSIQDLPELMEYKPKDSTISQWWFPREDFDTRIQILDDIINRLEKK